MSVLKPGHRNLCEQLVQVVWLVIQVIFWSFTALVAELWRLCRGAASR